MTANETSSGDATTLHVMLGQGQSSRSSHMHYSQPFHNFKREGEKI